MASNTISQSLTSTGKVTPKRSASQSASDIEEEQEDEFCQIITVPDLKGTFDMLTNIVIDFRHSLSGVKRMETIIYPILKCDNHFLQAPDPTKIEDLKTI